MLNSLQVEETGLEFVLWYFPTPSHKHPFFRNQSVGRGVMTLKIHLEVRCPWVGGCSVLAAFSLHCVALLLPWALPPHRRGI